VTQPYGWPGRTVDGPAVWLDPSFDDLIRRHPEFAAVRTHLPASASADGFDGQPDLRGLRSSYATRGYGSLFYALIRVLKPLCAIEIGLFEGFSLLSAGAALRDNGAGRISGYDLFDRYPYRHADRDQLARRIAQSDLESWVTIEDSDAADVAARWTAVDYLHVDVSNTGDTFRQVFSQWSGKVRQVILLEGGSGERDNVAWMRQYGKSAIAPAIADLRREYPGWSFSVLEPFPSLTIACNHNAIATTR
jgi:hypothetical protein